MRSLLNSSTGKRPPLLQKLLTHHKKYAILFYVLSIGYFLHMTGVIGDFNAEVTRISEHALMPGLVNQYFNDEAKIIEYSKQFEQHGVQRDYICEELEKNRVPCYSQRWNTTVAIKRRTGHNVYGVVRAHRATGVESMLFAVDMRDQAAVAMMMAFASYAREQVYWARDIFFVFLDGAEYGMDAFLSSYQAVSGAGITGEDLPVSGGFLLAGIVVGTHSGSMRQAGSSYFKVHLNQLNGQLPNLDLANSMGKLGERQRRKLFEVFYDKDQVEGVETVDLTPFRAMFSQAFVAIEGAHSVMGKYGVQGLRVLLPAYNSKFSLTDSAQFVEGIARFLNNVLERFHQSYFMYILAGNIQFLSIAYYMPSMTILLPLLIFAYFEWTEMTSFVFPKNFFVLHVPGAAILLISTQYFSVSTFSNENLHCLVAFLSIPYGLAIPSDKHHLNNMRFLIYLEMALILGALSLLNFSLAFFSALIVVPLMIKLSTPLVDRNRRLLRTAAALLTHPFAVYLFVLSMVVPHLLYRDSRLVEFTLDEITDFVKILLQDYLIFNSWNFPLFCCGAVYFWNCLLFFASTPPPTVPSTGEEQENHDQ